MIRLGLLIIISTLIFSCGNNSCPENCILVKGFVKDSGTGKGAADLPYEVYWVKKKTVSKLDLIDTGHTDAEGRINKYFPIDKDRFEEQNIFVRLLPNEKYGQIKDTYITQAIEDPNKPMNLQFVVYQKTDLQIRMKFKDPNTVYKQFLITYSFDGLEYKAYHDSGRIREWKYNVRTAAGLKTVVTAFTPLPSGIMKRKSDSIVCLPDTRNRIEIEL